MTQNGIAVAPQETRTFPEKTENPVSPTTSPSEAEKQNTPVQKKEEMKAEKEKFIFLSFHRTEMNKTERWEAKRKIADNKEVRFFINELSTLRPASWEETWACRKLYEIQYNEWVKIVIVELVVKTALISGKERVITFHTKDWNAVMPKWSHTEHAGNIVVKRVPLKEGPYPSSNTRSWNTKEKMMIACEESGRFQIIGVELIRPASSATHPNPRQMGRARETQKTANIKNNKVSRF